ncbi:hypothetical protein LJC18_05635 [Lachnospiraceae bacterium OttesenSCG-928-E19]|nr:hypothetical protein [Lachnospiraceae bacterium OttesenSCG-928-E19]
MNWKTIVHRTTLAKLVKRWAFQSMIKAEMINAFKNHPDGVIIGPHSISMYGQNIRGELFYFLPWSMSRHGTYINDRVSQRFIRRRFREIKKLKSEWEKQSKSNTK